MAFEYERHVPRVFANKTDLLTIRLVGDRQTHRPRLFADLSLSKRADRKAGVREGFGVQPVEEVALVLGLVHGAKERRRTLSVLLIARSGR